jgi:hypothetical protein
VAISAAQTLLAASWKYPTPLGPMIGVLAKEPNWPAGLIECARLEVIGIVHVRLSCCTFADEIDEVATRWLNGSPLGVDHVAAGAEADDANAGEGVAESLMAPIAIAASTPNTVATAAARVHNRVVPFLFLITPTLLIEACGPVRDPPARGRID